MDRIQKIESIKNAIALIKDGLSYLETVKFNLENDEVLETHKPNSNDLDALQIVKDTFLIF